MPATLTALAAAAGIALLAVVLVIGLTSGGVDTRIDRAIAAGERIPAPQFTLPVLSGARGLPAAGAPLRLADLRGRVVVLNIWASWCDSCRDEAPILESLWRRYRDRGVVVLGVNVRDLRERALAFQRTYGMSFPSVRDGEGDIMGRYGATGVPETFIIDHAGRVAVVVRGQLTTGGPDNAGGLETALLQVMREPTVTGAR
ncbi:MAG: TlpA disulfide reductase family protein [Thermoleophilia bacterium]